MLGTSRVDSRHGTALAKSGALALVHRKGQRRAAMAASGHEGGHRLQLISALVVAAEQWTPAVAKARRYGLPHFTCCFNGEICVWYGGKKENRNGGSVQQLVEIARSDALDYLVHEPEPTDYALWWLSTHGAAFVTLETMPRPSRRVSKRKR